MKPTSKELPKVFSLYWIAYIAYQIFLCTRVRIDFYDAFGNLCNARDFAGKFVGYMEFRLPLLPLLHAPLQKILDLSGSSSLARIVAPHLLQMTLSVGCLFIFYKYLRSYFSRRWAQMGVVLFSLNRMTLHYFWAVLPDLTCTLFLLLFFYFESMQSSNVNLEITTKRHPLRLLAGDPSIKIPLLWIPRQWLRGMTNFEIHIPKTLLSILALSACLLGRWNMLILPPGLAMFALLTTKAKQDKGSLAIRMLFFSACAYLAFAIALIAPYRFVLKMDWQHSTQAAIQVFNYAFQSNTVPETIMKYGQGLALSTGLLLIPFFVMFLRSLSKFSNRFLSSHALFFGYFIAIMGFCVGHKEARYLFPIMPSFYILALEGLRQGRAWSQHSLPKPAQWSLVAALVFSLAAGAGVEIARFADPTYADTIALDASDAVTKNLSGAGRIFWSGFSYSIAPKQFRFAGDDFYYLYHVPNSASMSYFTGRPVLSLDSGPLKDGDILIRTPQIPVMLNHPLTNAENKIEILKFSAGQWRLIATLPRNRT